MSRSGAVTYHTYVYDHLGNIRKVVNQDGTVEEQTNYFPYGGVMNDISTSGGVQLKKYNGKRLDRIHGLDRYDYGARYYDAALAMFTTMDPMAEKYYHISPYAYCLNNPIKFIDPDGMDPGDFFKTKDEAAKDFGIVYNPLSISKNIEYGASIFRTRNIKGEKGYTYTVPFMGNAEETRCSRPPLGIDIEAQIHSHGATTEGMANNVFSGEPGTSNSADLDIANEKQIDIYLSAPNGTLRKYDYQKKDISVIDTSLPSDVDGCFNANDYKHSFKKESFGNIVLDKFNVFVKGVINLLSK